MNSWSSPHHDPPGTLSIVIIWLRIVWRADATTRCCEITSASWNIFVDNKVSCLNLILLLYLVTREQIWQFPSFVCFKQRLLPTSELNCEPRNENISPGCDENYFNSFERKIFDFHSLTCCSAIPNDVKSSAVSGTVRFEFQINGVAEGWNNWRNFTATELSNQRRRWIATISKREESFNKTLS